MIHRMMLLLIVVSLGVLHVSMAQGVPQGGTLTFANDRFPATIDPGVHIDRFANLFSRAFLEPLFWEVAQGEYVPGVALSYSVSDDFTEYSLTIRQGMVFHDGTPVNAEAVKFTLERIVDPTTQSRAIGFLTDLDQIAVEGEDRILIRFSQPNPQFEQNLGKVQLSPLSPTAATSGVDFSRFPVGAGPFRIVDWPDENTMVMERFEEYYGGPEFVGRSGPAILDRIVMRIIQESSSRVAAFETRSAQLIFFPPFVEMDRIDQAPNSYLLRYTEQGLPQGMPLNVQNPPTDDIRVRQALNYAFNQDLLSRLVFFGWASPSSGVLSSNNWAYWPGSADYYPYDPARAASLLDEAGWMMNSATGIREKGGVPLRVRYVTNNNPTDARAAEIAQAMWREVGVDATVEAVVAEVSRPIWREGSHHVARLGLSFADPVYVLHSTYHSDMITAGGAWNRGHLINADVDRLLDQARLEQDVDVVKDLMWQVQKILLDEAVLVRGWEYTYDFGVSERVQGLELSYEGQFIWHNASVRE